MGSYYARYLNWLMHKARYLKWEYEVDTYDFPVSVGSRFTRRISSLD